MARRRGWGGTPPGDHHDASERIVEAAARVIDRLGADGFSLSEVALELGVSRPTVYRYFPSTEELLSAVGQHAMEEYSRRIQAHLAPTTDPVDWVVEGIAINVEWLPSRPHIVLLLTAGRAELFAQGFTSSVAIEMTRDAFRASSIDWTRRGFSKRDVDELIDLMHRLIASLLIDPPTPALGPAALRRYLHRWIAPAVREHAG